MTADTLPRGHTALSRDERVILAVWREGEAGGFKLGEVGVTAIVAYDEYGEMSFVPWLAIFNGDHLRARIPARFVEVHYQDPTP